MLRSSQGSKGMTFGEKMNRQIRKMCLKLDYKVKFLRRIRIMNINIGSLKLGRFRNFTTEELKGLFFVIKK